MPSDWLIANLTYRNQKALYITITFRAMTLVIAEIQS